MNIKKLMIISFLTAFCINIYAQSVLRYTVTVPQKNSQALTNAVVSSDTVDICCIYQMGQCFSADSDGNVQLIGEYTFSLAEAGVSVTDAGECKIKGVLHSYSNIEFAYTQPDMTFCEKVESADKGTQSVKVLKNAMLKAVKKSKVYKKNKKLKKSFKGMIYPMNHLCIRVGGNSVSVSETFCITDK